MQTTMAICEVETRGMHSYQGIQKLLYPSIPRLALLAEVRSVLDNNLYNDERICYR